MPSSETCPCGKPAAGRTTDDVPLCTECGVQATATDTDKMIEELERKYNAMRNEWAGLTGNFGYPGRATLAFNDAAHGHFPHLLKTIRDQRAALDRLLPKGEGGWMILSFKHGYVGNDCQFWRPGGAGYTCILSEAGVFTREKAMQTATGSDGECIALPVSEVVSRARLVVEIQRAGGTKGLRAAAEQAAAEEGGDE